MDEKEVVEEKRAKNFIWAAAEDYKISPMYLAFAPDGTADVYLNLMIGFSYRFYDGEKLETFFAMLDDKDQGLYEGMLWIGLECVIYKKEVKWRPALQELREEYARANLLREKKWMDRSLIERLRSAHCREILHQPSGLKTDEQILLEELDFEESLSTVELLDRIKDIYWKYFSYKPLPAKKKEGGYFLQKVLPAFRSPGKIENTYVRAKRYEDAVTGGEGLEKAGRKTTHYLLQFSFLQSQKASKGYIESCFGKSMYREWEQKKIENRLCTENHKNCHLLFTRGDAFLQSELTPKMKKEVQLFHQDSKKQAKKNEAYEKEYSRIHKTAIARIEQKIRVLLEEKQTPERERANSGRLCAKRVWRACYLGDEKVFRKKVCEEQMGFSVDIMIDASSSRKNNQEMIASQAYILAEALTRCKVPVQMYSYCSMKDYTVVRLYRSYEETDKNREIFQYVSAGNNRDGLALRAAKHLMKQSPMEKRMLFILTDASPNDERNVTQGAFYKNKEYSDQVGIDDTKNEIQNLIKDGVQVLGIVLGSEANTQAAKQIFGKRFVKIQDIGQFADACAFYFNMV